MDRGLVANAKLQLSYARITAPITGAWVTPGRSGQYRACFRCQRTRCHHANSAIAVVFTLPEDDLQSVMKQFHSNQGLAIEAYDRKGKIKLAQGQLLAVDNQIEPAPEPSSLKASCEQRQRVVFKPVC